MNLKTVLPIANFIIPQELIDHLVVHSGLPPAVCKIFALQYFNVIRYMLSTRQTLMIYGLMIRGIAREPHRLMKKLKRDKDG